MTRFRRFVANGSAMAAASVLAWLGSAWSIGLNSVAIYARDASQSFSNIATDASWLAGPVVLGAFPAWFLARAAANRGLGPERGRLSRWIIAAWVIDACALAGLWMLLLWHAGASPDAPGVDLPVLILAMWCTAFTAYVPVLIALQARRREQHEPLTADTDERDTEN